MIWIILAVCGGILLLFVGAMAITVDDWSRDLSTNVAETDPSASDPLLRPLKRPGTLDCAQQVLEQQIAQIPRWTLGPIDGSGEEVIVHATRKTPLWGFVDDIRVTIALVEAEQIEISVYSKSRLGKGDLGQNPRNIKELTSRLQEVNELAWSCGK
ncbi:DUF1499 domain-containing protein [Blastopirellula marina]|nr:DUF1499 domain-containing protein [Blastopirellula marina]